MKKLGIVGVVILVSAIAQAQAKFAPPACPAPQKPRAVDEARGRSYFCVDAKALKQGMVLRTMKFGDEERVIQRSQFKNDHEQSSVEYRYDARGRIVVAREKDAEGKTREGVVKYNEDQTRELMMSVDEGVQVLVTLNADGSIKLVRGTQKNKPMSGPDIARYDAQTDRMRKLLTSRADREPAATATSPGEAETADAASPR